MKNFIVILTFLSIGSISYGQSDSIFTDTVSYRITHLLPVKSVFTPLQGNQNLSPGCLITCAGASKYHLRTGYSGYDETATVIPDWYLDLNWEVVSNPCDGVALSETSKKCYSIEKPGYYADMDIDIDGGGAPFDDIQTIRPGGGCGTNYGSYKFQTKFCLSTDATGISLDMKCLSDNNATVYLNGIEIASQGDVINGWALTNLIDVSLIDSDPIDDLFLEGENIVEVVVNNYGFDNLPYDQSRIGEKSSPILLAAYVNVSVSSGCVGCCNNKSAIWGVKHNDLNADGILQEDEPPLAGVTIDLYLDDIFLTSTITDDEGVFLFTDLDPGTYDVKEPAFGTWTCTSPAAAEYTDLIITEYGTINNLRFLNTEFTDYEGPCEACGDSFAPLPGERYWISAWVKVEHLDDDPQKTYSQALDGPFLRTIFLGTASVIPEFFPTGEIIDGWQRIVGSFTVPGDATNFLLTMNADPDFATYFDDIRIHPFNGSMKSYVYDGETFWLTSELDDNNYATFYEYDQEGGLIRIKKETSRGIVTIQETRSNTIKK